MDTMKNEIPTFDAIVRQLGVESGIARWHSYMSGTMLSRGNDLEAQAKVLLAMGYAGTGDEIQKEIWAHENPRFLALRKTGGSGTDNMGTKLSDPEVPTPAYAYEIVEEVWM